MKALSLSLIFYLSFSPANKFLSHGLKVIQLNDEHELTVNEMIR